jgi:hypothetical protein
MFTNEYKGLFIAGYFDNSKCRVLWPYRGEVLPGYTFKSYRAAQLFITKLMQHQK